MKSLQVIKDELEKSLDEPVMIVDPAVYIAIQDIIEYLEEREKLAEERYPDRSSSGPMDTSGLLDSAGVVEPKLIKPTGLK